MAGTGLGIAGAITHYVLEGTSINIMVRAGWRSNMIKVGDKVTAVAAPSKDGKPTGLLLEVTFASGEKKDMSIPDTCTFKRPREAGPGAMRTARLP